jgi:hypothetical protein
MLQQKGIIETKPEEKARRVFGKCHDQGEKTRG